MADINVERKRGSNVLAWVLGAVVLLVAAFLLWSFLSRDAAEGGEGGASAPAEAPAGTGAAPGTAP